MVSNLLAERRQSGSRARGLGADLNIATLNRRPFRQWQKLVD